MAAPDPIRDQPFERALPNSAEAERAILGIPDKEGGVRRLEMHPAPRADDPEVFTPALRAAADEVIRE